MDGWVNSVTGGYHDVCANSEEEDELMSSDDEDYSFIEDTPTEEESWAEEIERISAQVNAGWHVPLDQHNHPISTGEVWRDWSWEGMDANDDEFVEWGSEEFADLPESWGSPSNALGLDLGPSVSSS